MMQRDSEIVVVCAPQLLEQKLSLTTRVHEDQRGLVRLDERVDFTERMARRVAGPGQVLGRVEHRDIGLRTGLRHDEIGKRPAPRRLRDQEAAQIVRLGNGRGETDRR